MWPYSRRLLFCAGSLCRLADAGLLFIIIMAFFKKRKKKKPAKEGDLGYVSTLYPVGSQAYDTVIDVPYFHRELVRPKINFWLVALYVVLVVGGSVGLYFGSHALLTLFVSNGTLAEDFPCVLTAVLIAVGAFLIVMFFVRKRFFIFFVKVYQRYASDEVRLRCPFTPSCSEYMILSIQKYGVIKGIYKGWRRLKRCSLPGGIDYP